MTAQTLPLAPALDSLTVDSLSDFEPRTHSLSPLQRAQSATPGLKVGAGGMPGLKVGDGDESAGEGPR
jgi:hypothetical protein